MSEQSLQIVLFPDRSTKPLVASFDTPQLSSDGRAILLKAINERLGLTARLAACLPEWRQVGRVEHEPGTLVRHR